MKMHHPQATQVSSALLFVNVLMSTLYFIAIVWVFSHGNAYLFAIFLIGEVFHLWQIITYTYTIWNVGAATTPVATSRPSIDVFITVAGEPVDLVRTTLIAVQGLNYSNFKIYLLNDGYVAKKPNWQDIENLASEFGVACITRKIPGGAKAGNINNALKQTTGELVVIFDADHVPTPEFLTKTIGFFNDPAMGFVQSPQFYGNYTTNYITGGAWEQQELFFGPLMRGKNRLNATFMCGTNMVLRRAAILDVGGMCETNIAEDFLTSLFLHERGWRSAYVDEVLATGLAPEDFSSYYKQQYRWARGSLEVIFKYNPLWRNGLSWPQRIQYLASASYYLTGFVVIMNALLPIVFFFTGLVVFNIATMALAVVFIPYIFISLLALQQSSNFTFTFRALAFSYGSFWLQMSAVVAVLLNRKTSFVVTSKQQVGGNFIHLVIPNIIYIILAIVGGSFAVYRYGLNASVVTNMAWALLNIGLFVPMIIAASPYGVRPSRHTPEFLNTQRDSKPVSPKEVMHV